MTTEREEALELAREAGGTSCYTWYSFYEFRPDAVEKLVRLAKQRGAEEQKRKDVEICESLPYEGHDRFLVCADAIRSQNNEDDTCRVVKKAEEMS